LMRKELKRMISNNSFQENCLVTKDANLLFGIARWKGCCI